MLGSAALSTIFSFPEQNSVSWCFGHKLIGIATLQPITSFRTSLCSAFQNTTTIFASTYSDLSHQSGIVLLWTLLAEICGAVSIWLDLHIRITVTMCVGVVIPPSVGQSASSTGWYITHTILTYSLRSINVNLTTVISTQWPSYPLSDPRHRQTTIIVAPPWVPRWWPTGVSNWTTEICAYVLKKTTQDIDAVSSQSAFTEDLAAVQGWTTKHDKSTIPLYPNITLYTEVRGVAMTGDQVSKSYSDIESLTLSLWHRLTSTWQIGVYRHLQAAGW